MRPSSAPRAAFLLLAAALVLSGCAATKDPQAAASTTPAPHTHPANATAPPAPLAFHVPAKVTTFGDTAWANGTATPGAVVWPIDVHGRPANATADAQGAFHLPLAASYGHRTFRLGARLGSQLALANVTVVRFAQATMQVKFSGYPGHADRDDKVWYDPDGNASASLYTGKDLSHPNYANVHDLMVTWTNQTGVKVEYGYSNGLGFSVSRIDGAGLPVDAPAGLPSVQNDYWCYDLNGASASLGITGQKLAPGDVVAWSLGCSG